MNSCILTVSSGFLSSWATGRTSRNQGRNFQDEGSSGRVVFSNWKVAVGIKGKELTLEERSV